MNTIKVISWNIAGARPIKSLGQFDYAQEDVDYFVTKILDQNPDIVCLQESHSNTKRILANEIAKKVNMSYVFNVNSSPSHIDPNYELSLAIISKFPLEEQQHIIYPYPSFKLIWPNGKEADVHHKLLQITKVKNFYIANTQMLPINIWKYDYGKEEGFHLAQQIEDILLNNIKGPIIFCGDFNYDFPKNIYSRFLTKLNLKDALEDEELTRPSDNNLKKKPDHIFYSPEFKVNSHSVIKTDTDHYLCFSEFTVDLE